MKTAKLSVLAFEVQCPYCLELSEDPYWGSLMWQIFDGDSPVIWAGKLFECSYCDKTFKMPKVVSNNKLPEIK